MGPKNLTLETGRKLSSCLFLSHFSNVQKIQVRLARELEKKFSGKHVVVVAQRRVLPKPTRKTRSQKQMRPRSRTLTAVHDSILEDLVYPSEIVGKSVRVKLDASRLVKVVLEKAQQ